MLDFPIKNTTNYKKIKDCSRRKCIITFIYDVIVSSDISEVYYETVNVRYHSKLDYFQPSVIFTLVYIYSQG
jgi:hypothetical protein